MQVALKYCQGSFVPCIHTRGVARENLVQREEQRSGDAPKKALLEPVWVSAVVGDCALFAFRVKNKTVSFIVNSTKFIVIHYYSL